MTIAKTSRSISIVSLILLLFTGYCIFDLKGDITRQHRMDADRAALQTLSKELQETSWNLTVATRNFAVTGEARYITTYDDFLAVRSGTRPRPKGNFIAPGEQVPFLDLVKRYHVTDEEIDLLEEVLNRSIEVGKIEARVFEIAKQGDLKKAREIIYGDDYISQRRQVAKPLDTFEEKVVHRIVTAATDASEQVENNIVLLCIFIAVNIGLAVFSAFFTDRRIVHRLDICSQYAARLAEGNYENKVTKKHNDELGTMVDTLNHMVDSLQARINDAEKATAHAGERQKEAEAAVKEAEAAKAQAESARRDGMLQAANDLTTVVNAVSEVSKALHGGITLSDKGAKEQAHIVLETVGSMEEMKAAVHGVAESASHASSVAQDVRAKAQEGVDQVAQVTTSMAELSQASSKISQDMELLGKQANDIGAILSTISDIADQTNLLALNAAIEAARAGEAGRGFAVVADEVRKLAEKTMTATQEVNNSISAIQHSVHTNIENVGATGEMAQHVTEIVQRSGEVLDEIHKLAEASADQVRSIASAAEEQSSSCDHIGNSVDAINKIANQVADTMQDADSAVKDLLQQADHLSGLIEAMKRG